MRYIFVSGMFRSGTTLLARMLNSHSNIAFASDPMRPLFNRFRYTVASTQYQSEHDPYEPLGDYFLTDVSLLKDILASDFEIRPNDGMADLFERAIRHAKPYSGLWASSLHPKENVQTYRELIQHFLDHIEATYGEGKTLSCVGFKEVWINEMVPPLLKSFPDAKAIVMIRDPRAVTASNNVTEAKYPVFFLARQWRKLTFLGKYMARQTPDRILIMRYEDLVENPEKEVKKLCAFIDVPYAHSLLDPSTYLDGDKKPWKQNTHYNYDGKGTICKDSLQKWHTVLERPDLLTIELIGRDWMEVLGYHVSFSLSELMKTPPSDFRRWTTAQLSEWIRPYSFDENDDTFFTEVVKEKLRLQYVYSSCDFSCDDDFSLQNSRFIGRK